MSDISIEESQRIYHKNNVILFFLQEKLDQNIRSKICADCTLEKKDKRKCIDHNGKRFCQVLVKKRKENKQLTYAWQFNLLNYSPLLLKSDLLSKVANSWNIQR
jgi:hypothetical protein